MQLTDGERLRTPIAESELSCVFREQRAAFDSEPLPSAAARSAWLDGLGRALLENEAAIAQAISADFGHRPATETRLLEMFPSIELLRHARRHLRRWMRTERRPVALWFQPGVAEIRYQPLGVVGIVVPWNYPLYLAVGPLTSALAAGNRAMIKLSELTPHFNAAFSSIVAQQLPRHLVHVVEGDVEISRSFVDLPFDHLLFTGSTRVGREVMSRAAQHLTPVTLELGGKSPAIIAPGFDLQVAARRIVFGKLINAGQTCIAPDYVLAPADAIEPLLVELRRAATAMYGSADSADYASIVNEPHFERLTQLLADARNRGAHIETLLPPSVSSRPGSMPPAVVLGCADDMRIMQEEIFGPLLPIVPYANVDAAVRYVNERPRPLALYVFDDDVKRRETLLVRTASGGVTINDTVLHVGQADLPFGGVGASGMGRYHGQEGFRTFSQVRSVYRQSRLSAASLLYPPYGRLVKRNILKLMLRRR